MVPTTQIYRQTIQNLRNREHPYRQHLDIASGGRTMILEKTDRFTPLDVAENLIVLMLMLPSAARQSKETLKVFRDNGGFQEFFPAEDDIQGHRRLLERMPNLDVFKSKDGFWGAQMKTSLGNTLRLLSPVIVLDEGHKAYSPTAQDTLRGFNPSMIVELSATPPKESNILVDIRGVELNREEMIKLDLHIINKASADWKDTLLASVDKQQSLEEKANRHRANTGVYIRPIVLIQVERTGKGQRDGKHIHTDDAREHLVKVIGVPEEHIAIKTSDKDELKAVDDVGGLMSEDSQIRYIITKQALQEGWDCAFAYILVILTNPTSKNALTQLVGRILRQPYARKTKVPELDESYVLCYQQRGNDLLKEIKKGFQDEGLGDLAGRVATDEGFEEDAGIKEKVYGVRPRFKVAAERTILPVFVVNDGNTWRPVNYEMDILSRVSWRMADTRPLFELALSPAEEKDKEHIATIEESRELVRQREVRALREGGLRLFLTRHLVDLVPNPWVAHELGDAVLSNLLGHNDQKLVVNNFVFIIEELRRQLEAEKDRLAKEVFHSLLKKGVLRFLVVGEDSGFKFPKAMRRKTSSQPLANADGEPLQRSLFAFVADEEFNEMERHVAWYLEEQSRLFFWYRNVARQDYAIQGWRKQKIYPDFIFTADSVNEKDYEKVFVLETKGMHLKNEDTGYKQSIFAICNEAQERSFNELSLAFKDKPARFEVAFEEEWRRKLNELINSRS